MDLFEKRRKWDMWHDDHKFRNVYSLAAKIWALLPFSHINFVWLQDILKKLTKYILWKF